MPEMLTPSPVPQPQSGAVHRRMVRGFLLTMAIMAVVAVFVYRNIRELIEMHNWVAHTHEVLGVLQDTHAATNEVNASQRIYRLTGNVQDSAPYNLARMRATRNIERLRWLMKDNPVQLGNLAALEAEVLEQVTRASNAIARHEQQTLESSEIDRNA